MGIQDISRSKSVPDLPSSVMQGLERTSNHSLESFHSASGKAESTFVITGIPSPRSKHTGSLFDSSNEKLDQVTAEVHPHPAENSQIEEKNESSTFILKSNTPVKPPRREHKRSSSLGDIIDGRNVVVTEKSNDDIEYHLQTRVVPPLPQVSSHQHYTQHSQEHLSSSVPVSSHQHHSQHSQEHLSSSVPPSSKLSSHQHHTQHSQEQLASSVIQLSQVSSHEHFTENSQEHIASHPQLHHISSRQHLTQHSQEHLSSSPPPLPPRQHTVRRPVNRRGGEPPPPPGGEPPPPLAVGLSENEQTSDFFEEITNGKHDSDAASELDPDTLQKILDMQEEIMRCDPSYIRNSNHNYTRGSQIRTPVKLELTSDDFNETYARQPPTPDGDDVDFSFEQPFRLRRAPPAIRMRYGDFMNKSGNNSHTDILEDLVYQEDEEDRVGMNGLEGTPRDMDEKPW